MWRQTKYLFLFSIAIGCVSSPIQAQTSVQDFEQRGMLDYPPSFETEIHQSILALRKAEFSLDDTLVANQLEAIGYLAIAQSGFTALKKDIHQRTGYWMLSYPVAIKYGLRINSIIDERKNLTKSTKAAFLYWQDLYTIYKNEELTDLAFSTSVLAVSKFRMDSVNEKEGVQSLRTRALKISHIKKIYQETTIKPVDPVTPAIWVSSSKSISFESIHHFTKVPIGELIRLNPQWINEEYNPLYGRLTLPLAYKAIFEERVSDMEQKTKDEKVLLVAANTKRIKQLKGNIPNLKTHKPIRYKVKAGDNLGRIAQRHHVKTSSIRAWNELKSDRIYAGQKLTIYVPMNQNIEVVKKAPKKVKKSTIKRGEYQEYTVKTGDTLWAISQLFESVTADMIMEDNGIDENIAPGQVLKIRKLK